MKGPELINMYVGQSEQNVRDGKYNCNPYFHWKNIFLSFLWCQTAWLCTLAHTCSSAVACVMQLSFSQYMHSIHITYSKEGWKLTWIFSITFFPCSHSHIVYTCTYTLLQCLRELEVPLPVSFSLMSWILWPPIEGGRGILGESWTELSLSFWPS